eukprot:scaffold23348_cov117-Skeletonema_dohrnii-CCMP3373.AAC.3
MKINCIANVSYHTLTIATWGYRCDATVLITSASARAVTKALFVTTHDLVTSRKKIVTALQCGHTTVNL